MLIDGVRQQEWNGQALDENGRKVRLGELFPNLLQLRKSGIFFPKMQISNPVGVSLPAYADIFSGRRQEKILSNGPPVADFRSHYPTFFQEIKRQLGLPFDGVALHASWTPLCTISQTAPIDPKEDFYRSCGFRSNAQAPVQYFKPEVYGGSRTDIDTALRLGFNRGDNPISGNELTVSKLTSHSACRVVALTRPSARNNTHANAAISTPCHTLLSNACTASRASGSRLSSNEFITSS